MNFTGTDFLFAVPRTLAPDWPPSTICAVLLPMEPTREQLFLLFPMPKRKLGIPSG